MNTTTKNLDEVLAAAKNKAPSERSRLETYAFDLHAVPARRNEAVTMVRGTLTEANERAKEIEHAKKHGAPKPLIDGAEGEVRDMLENADAMIEALRLNGYYFWN